MVDEPDVLETQVTREVAKLMGPVRPVDVEAVFAAITMPRVKGRTGSMFSPARALVAGVFVFALGGALLVAQPFGDPGGDPPGANTGGTVTQPPVEFIGQIECGPPDPDGTGPWDVVHAGTREVLADGTTWQVRGHAVRQTATMSDPRLEGTYYLSEDRDEYHVPGNPFPMIVASWTRRIENDEGAWQGSLTFAYPSDGMEAGGTAILVGERAYEGLTAIWEERTSQTGCSGEVRGVIIDGTVPAAPEPFTAE
jgi:hypothetical protein